MFIESWQHSQYEWDFLGGKIKTLVVELIKNSYWCKMSYLPSDCSYNCTLLLFLPHKVKRRFNTLHVVISQHIPSSRWDGLCGITKAGTICPFLLRETPSLASPSRTSNPLESLIYNLCLYRVSGATAKPLNTALPGSPVPQNAQCW